MFYWFDIFSFIFGWFLIRPDPESKIKRIQTDPDPKHCFNEIQIWIQGGPKKIPYCVMMSFSELASFFRSEPINLNFFGFNHPSIHSSFIHSFYNYMSVKRPPGQRIATTHISDIICNVRSESVWSKRTYSNPKEGTGKRRKRKLFIFV